MSTKNNLSLRRRMLKLLENNKGKPINVAFGDGSSFVINTKDELDSIMPFVDDENEERKVVAVSVVLFTNQA